MKTTIEVYAGKIREQLHSDWQVIADFAETVLGRTPWEILLFSYTQPEVNAYWTEHEDGYYHWVVSVDTVDAARIELEEDEPIWGATAEPGLGVNRLKYKAHHIIRVSYEGNRSRCGILQDVSDLWLGMLATSEDGAYPERCRVCLKRSGEGSDVANG